MRWVILVLILVVAGCTVEITEETHTELEVVNMKITSSEFSHNDMIPAKFTCQGANINPELNIEDVPEGTVSLVLIMDDPDAPMGTWDHWILFNMDPVNKITEDSAPGVEGVNSGSRTGYGGPCPPSGTHRYFFKLYALDTKLELDSSADKKDVEEAMQGHVLEKAELIGLYQKS